MQHKCQLSLFLFRGYQPAFTEEYLFLLKKVPPQRFELEGLFHLRFQKSAWFGWQGPGPARRSLWPWSQAGLGRARPAPSPRSGTLHPRPRRLVPPSPGCGCCTGPGPHRAPAGLAASAPKGREAEALSYGATWRPRWQPAATGLFFGRRRGRSRVSAPLNGTYQALRGWVRVCYAFCGQPTRLRGVWGEGEAAGRAEWSSAGASLRLPLFSRAPSSSSVGRVNGSVPPSWPPP